MLKLRKLYCLLVRKLIVLNIKLFHRNEWVIHPNGRMYNKKQLQKEADKLFNVFINQRSTQK